MGQLVDCASGCLYLADWPGGGKCGGGVGDRIVAGVGVLCGSKKSALPRGGGRRLRRTFGIRCGGVSLGHVWKISRRQGGYDCGFSAVAVDSNRGGDPSGKGLSTRIDCPAGKIFLRLEQSENAEPGYWMDPHGKYCSALLILLGIQQSPTADAFPPFACFAALPLPVGGHSKPARYP